MDPVRISLVFCLLLTLDIAYSEEISFPSGIRLTTVDENSVPDPDEVRDVKQTGSYLFNAETYINKALSLGVIVQHFKSPSSKYFRSHPAFIECIQKVMTDLQNQNKGLMISSGFQTKTDVSNRQGLRYDYSRSGTGILLMFKPGSNGETKDIASAALRKCPVIFERLQRNIGVIMVGNNAVHLHMTNTQDAAPYFGIEGFTGMTEDAFKTWCLDQIDAGIDPAAVTDCSKIPILNSGEFFPSDVTSAEDVIGEVDSPITRQTPADFITLVQYQGRNVDFVDSEHSHTWCGVPSNNCVDCREKPVGNSLSQRCANRLMSQRMYDVISRLQKLVRTQTEKLKIETSFVEKTDATEATYDTTALHTEGRLLVASLTSGSDANKMKMLAQLAICAKADYVKNDGDKVIIGVKKMSGFKAQKIAFPTADMLRVEPPTAKKDLYSLPTGFTEEDEEEYPLMDSSRQKSLVLADGTPLGLFVSKDPSIRYFRLKPSIAQCFSQIRYNLNKHNKNGNPTINLEIVQGFMSTQEQHLKIEATDKRYNTMTLGTGFELRYSKSNTEKRPLHTLVKLAIDYCGPIFHEVEKQEIGVGIYQDRIFVDIRNDFDLWTKFLDQLPSNFKVLSEYREEKLQRFELAVENRIVDPDDLEKACKLANHPGMQSPNFVHQHSDFIQRRRRAATLPDPDDCIPKANTKFCTDTLKHRQTEVDRIWTELTRKWIYHDRQEVKQALDGCFLACGTCLEGSIYEDKKENCNNFLHWVPFDLMNDVPGVTNFFPRDSMELRYRACKNGHCIEDAPLFHLVASSAEAIYRPDPQASVENELYPQADNPSPVLELLSRIYAIHASGTVKFWVRDENDMLSLKAPLEVAMLYNKNVTNIEVFVKENSKREAVEAVIQTYVADWSNTGCPKVTREVIASSTVLPMPADIGKRSIHAEIRENIIDHYTNWESRWINRDL